MNGPFLPLAMTLTAAMRALRKRARRSDRGQTGTEYLGIIILVAAIITAIFGFGIADNIAGAINDAVNEVINAA